MRDRDATERNSKPHSRRIRVGPDAPFIFDWTGTGLFGNRIRNTEGYESVKDNISENTKVNYTFSERNSKSHSRRIRVVPDAPSIFDWTGTGLFGNRIRNTGRYESVKDNILENTIGNYIFSSYQRNSKSQSRKGLGLGLHTDTPNNRII